MRLNAFERRLWNGFMNQLSDCMNNAGCNSFHLENTPEARRMLEEIIRTQYKPKDQPQLLVELKEDVENAPLNDGKLTTLDINVFAHLKNKIDEILNENEATMLGWDQEDWYFLDSSNC